MKDHSPIVIEEFNGLWARGDEDSCPLDHFSECNNVWYFESGVETRPGIDVLDRGGPFALGDILRMYNYVMETGESLLTLVEGGKLYHCLLDGSGTIHGPILTISGMTDFGFQTMGKYAYITPFTTYTKPTGENYQWGLENEFVYVYKGDGSSARKAAGDPPSNGGDTCLVAYTTEQIGEVTQGYHVVGVATTNSTDRSNIGPESLAVVFAPGDLAIAVNNIFQGEPAVTGREIYMTKAIRPEDWNPVGDLRSNYEFFLAKVIDNVTEISTVINVKDEDLTTVYPGVTGSLNTPTTSAMFMVNSEGDGYCDLGLHVMGVVFETDTGYLTAPGPEFFAVQTFVNEQKAIDVYGIPTGGLSVIKRHLVCTRFLSGFNGNNRADQFEYQFYFVPGGLIDNNTDTEKQVSFYDAELLEDASHLIDNFSEIPAGVGLATYNGRMVLFGLHGHENESLAYISAKGEPEAFDQIEGFVKFPTDGNPITNAQEFRDSLYLFKKTKTAVTTDNGSSPAFWEGPIIIDHGIGASVHGIANVLDSDGVNIDYILVVDWSGIMVFAGRYLFPPLTWKIEDLWEALERNAFANIQIMNDSILHRIYMTLPNKQMLYGDWDNGLDAKSVKWCPWTFDIETTTIALIESNRLLIGSNSLVES